MKNLKLIMFLILTGLFIGCSSDDDGGGNIDASIIGTWRATDVEVNGVVSTVINGNNISQNVSPETENINYTLVFNEDNTVNATGGFDIIVNISFLGQSFEETLEDVAPVGTGTWSLSGNQLTINSGGEPLMVTIDELSESLLTLRLTTPISTVVDGQEVTGSFESTMYLQRQ